MRWLKPNHQDTAARMFSGALKGVLRGLAAGAAFALLTGVAVVMRAPPWVPFLSGMAVVSFSAVALWSFLGAGLGALVGAVAVYLKKRRIDILFRRAGFGNPEDREER